MPVCEERERALFTTEYDLDESSANANPSTPPYPGNQCPLQSYSGSHWPNSTNGNWNYPTPDTVYLNSLPSSPLNTMNHFPPTCDYDWPPSQPTFPNIVPQLSYGSSQSAGYLGYGVPQSSIATNIPPNLSNFDFSACVTETYCR